MRRRHRRRMIWVALIIALLGVAPVAAHADSGMIGSGTAVGTNDEGGGTIGSGTRTGYFGSGH
jgi:hypothetical protein